MKPKYYWLVTKENVSLLKNSEILSFMEEIFVDKNETDFELPDLDEKMLILQTELKRRYNARKN